jgi:RimJ/RimL family protein N-acetyltransferase
MSAAMTDISARVPPRDARVYAIVHEDNRRSIALCRRHGLTEEMSRPHPSYRRVVTPHQTIERL